MAVKLNWLNCTYVHMLCVLVIFKINKITCKIKGRKYRRCSIPVSGIGIKNLHLAITKQQEAYLFC